MSGHSAGPEAVIMARLHSIEETQNPSEKFLSGSFDVKFWAKKYRRIMLTTVTLSSAVSNRIHEIHDMQPRKILLQKGSQDFHSQDTEHEYPN